MPFIVESNMKVTEVSIEKDDGQFVLISLKGTFSRICIRRSRIFDTMEQAEQHIPYRQFKKQSVEQRRCVIPYDYEPGGCLWTQKN